MPPTTISHSTGSYQVHVEPGILLSLPALLAEVWGERPMAVISDDTVLRLYDEWTHDTAVARPLGAGGASNRVQSKARLSFPAGEEAKTRQTWQMLTDELLAQGMGRDSAVVAIGGGVVGDLAGFVAATYLRGIPYAQVPTTLLAMLDASVGGKVGVDTVHGKNLVGAFHPPAIVVADPLTLLSLPERVYRSGLAEAVKHGLIADAEYFDWIERNAVALLSREESALTHLVRRSVEIKAQVVMQDEREGGRRAILNAGHSIAHALELESEYQLAHGEAVALGLVAETRIAETMGLAPAGLAERVARLVSTLGLPRALAPDVDQARVVRGMALDKKNRGGQLHLALPNGLGTMHQTEGRWTVPVPAASIAEVLATLA